MCYLDLLFFCYCPNTETQAMVQSVADWDHLFIPDQNSRSSECATTGVAPFQKWLQVQVLQVRWIWLHQYLLSIIVCADSLHSYESCTDYIWVNQWFHSCHQKYQGNWLVPSGSGCLPTESCTVQFNAVVLMLWLVMCTRSVLFSAWSVKLSPMFRRAVNELEAGYVFCSDQRDFSRWPGAVGSAHSDQVRLVFMLQGRLRTWQREKH